MLKGINALKSLKVANFSFNFIEEVEVLKLPSLEVLILQGNQLKTFCNVDYLTGLLTLDLSKNKLANLNFVISDSGLKRLQTLDTAYNEIEKSYLDDLLNIIRQFEGLDNLNLIANPVASHPLYFNSVLSVRQLSYLDGSKVKPNQLKILQVVDFSQKYLFISPKEYYQILFLQNQLFSF